MVRTDSEKTIDTASTSPLGGGKPGRTKRKNLKSKKDKNEGEEKEWFRN